MQNYISDEMMASLIDGELDSAESIDLLNSLSGSEEHFETFCIASQAAMLVDDGLEPAACVERFAAQTIGCGDMCCVLSEIYALGRLGIETEKDEAVELAVESGWYIAGQGTPVGAIGKITAYYGCCVEVQTEATPNDLAKMNDRGYIPLVYLDGGELFGDKDAEVIEDEQIGKIADHVVVVEGVDFENREVALYDPAIGEGLTYYDIEDFLQAWDDSDNMVVLIKDKKL